MAKSMAVPDLVRTRINLHMAEADHRACKLDADLRGRVIGHTLSRRLREARDQAKQEAEAWAMILANVTGRCPTCGCTFEDCTCTGATPE
jgi:hypothetical protein